jgi:hypothetical protein
MRGLGNVKRRPSGLADRLLRPSRLATPGSRAN